MMNKEDFIESAGQLGAHFPHLKIMFDGSCGPVNPNGNMGYGYAIINVEDNDVIAEGWGYTMYDGTANTSNNVAEWVSLKRGLELMLASGYTCDKLDICGDSMLVIRQVRGSWGIKGGSYVKVAKAVLESFGDELAEANVYHVYRNDNDYCDYLSNKYVYYLKDNYGIDTGGEFKVENVKKKSRFLK